MKLEGVWGGEFGASLKKGRKLVKVIESRAHSALTPDRR